MTAAERMAGALLIRLDLAGSALFGLTAALAVASDGPARIVAVAVALGLFALGAGAYLVGYARAVQRSRMEVISMAGLAFLAGAAPTRVRAVLLGSTIFQVVVALVSASLRPFTTLAFGIMAPLFGLGMQALWSARHGRFPPRAKPSRRKGPPGPT